MLFQASQAQRSVLCPDEDMLEVTVDSSST